MGAAQTEKLSHELVASGSGLAQAHEKRSAHAMALVQQKSRGHEDQVQDRDEYHTDESNSVWLLLVHLFGYFNLLFFYKKYPFIHLYIIEYMNMLNEEDECTRFSLCCLKDVKTRNTSTSACVSIERYWHECRHICTLAL